MNSLLKFFLNPTFRTFQKCDPHALFLKESNLVRTTKSLVCCSVFSQPKNFFHLYTPRMKDSKANAIRRAALSSRKEENIAEGEHFVDIEGTKDRELFPTADLPERLFDGIPYKNTPIIHVKATKRNTKMYLTVDGAVKVVHSCSKAGFKNCKKGTGIAAQTTGTYFGQQASKKGYKTVRVVVEGLGSGRLSGLKGLQLGGMNIISITDVTRDIMTQRPKKQRRL